MMNYTLLKSLGHSYDEKLRDESLNQVCQTLGKDAIQLRDEIFLRDLWEGLFFFFWHADKLRYQNEAAERIAEIIDRLPEDLALRFFREFVECLMKHWNDIDKYRQNKFLYLIRMHLRAILRYAAGHSSMVESLGETMKEYMVHKTEKADGVSLQLIEVYLDELQETWPKLGLAEQELFLDPLLHGIIHNQKQNYLIALEKEIDRVILREVYKENHLRIKKFAKHILRHALDKSLSANSRKKLYSFYKKISKYQNIPNISLPTTEVQIQPRKKIIGKKLKKIEQLTKRVEKVSYYQEGIPNKLFELMQKEQSEQAPVVEEVPEQPENKDIVVDISEEEFAPVSKKKHRKRKTYEQSTDSQPKKKVTFALAKNSTRIYSEDLKVSDKPHTQKNVPLPSIIKKR